MSSQSNQDTVADGILQELSTTDYACSSLTRLSGGTVNFVYRGILTNSDTMSSVIVKHSKPHLAGNEGYLLDVSRAEFEAATLKHLDSTMSNTQKSVQIPRCYLYNGDTHTTILEDIGPDAIDIKSVLTTHHLNEKLTQDTALSIGHKLGAWLRQFHAGKLTTTAGQAEELPPKLEPSSNTEIRKLKYNINYGTFIEILSNFPGATTAEEGMVMNRVRDMASQEASSFAGGEKGEHCGQVHGDFWMGKQVVLLNEKLSLKSAASSVSKSQSEMTVIDWEFTHINHFCYDLGQMLGDLLERYLLNDVPSSLWMVRGFTQGYKDIGRVDEDLALRSAIHAGVHLLGWYNRRAPWHELTGTGEQKKALVRMAVDLIVKGWEKDVDWFKGSVLADLFD